MTNHKELAERIALELFDDDIICSNDIKETKSIVQSILSEYQGDTEVKLKEAEKALEQVAKEYKDNGCMSCLTGSDAQSALDTIRKESDE